MKYKLSQNLWINDTNNVGLTCYDGGHQVAIYAGGGVSPLEWREVSPLLPARIGLRTAVVDNIIYALGGSDSLGILTSILSWDPLTESWQAAGDLKVGRHHHAAVAIPSSIIESECSAMP